MRLLLNLPVPYRAPLGIKAEAYLDDGQAAEGELGGIVVEVYLPHGSLGRLVELQLKQIKILVCAHDHVDTPLGRVNFHIVISAHEGEDDLEELLVVTL